MATQPAACKVRRGCQWRYVSNHGPPTPNVQPLELGKASKLQVDLDGGEKLGTTAVDPIHQCRLPVATLLCFCVLWGAKKATPCVMCDVGEHGSPTHPSHLLPFQPSQASMVCLPVGANCSGSLSLIVSPLLMSLGDFQLRVLFCSLARHHMP